MKEATRLGGGLFIVAFYSFASFEIDEMETIAGEAGHRFIIVIRQWAFKPMLHILFGHRTGENHVCCHKLTVAR
ncbi:hypothetical protein [Bradyrhizobium sp.]|uniref:hypothetical protein n=1 Tax=Bradyrhizobium sp. TaxID=376 RepID=UPI003C593AB1